MPCWSPCGICCLFFYFEHVLWSFCLTAVCWIVVYADRIEGGGGGRVNRSGATRVVALKITKTLDRVWQTSLLQVLGISGQVWIKLKEFFFNSQIYNQTKLVNNYTLWWQLTYIKSVSTIKKKFSSKMKDMLTKLYHVY